MEDEDDAGAARDHHDYAKRRRACQDAAPPPAPKKVRAHRDPEGGTYISARARARRVPLPMKLRALPASFWEQPNLNKGPSPGAIFAALPPLCKDVDVEAGASGQPEARDDRGAAPGPDEDTDSAELVSLSPADTDLLFSLFRSVEAQTTVRRRARGRPRRAAAFAGPGSAQSKSQGPRDDDPCLLDSLTGGLLAPRQRDGLAMLDGGRDAASLRAGSGDHNLAQILSDLVVKL